MNRKLYIFTFLVFLCAKHSISVAQERPNFVFIYTDDQRYDAIGIVQREQGKQARFPWINTPHTDRLATEGVRFRNAFVTTSLCSPSRAAFLTGRYNHANGIKNNTTSLPINTETYASLLRNAGYKTGYVGKWHMGSQVERPGFDYSASFKGQGQYFDCPIFVDGKETPSKGWVDDVSTDYALDFLRVHQKQPFALVLGFKTCHGPFESPERVATTYIDEKPRPVPSFDVPAIYKSQRPGQSATLANRKSPAEGDSRDSTAKQTRPTPRKDVLENMNRQAIMQLYRAAPQ
jgi:N-acetylglucosamine-6-sulfatase